jgi:hypothetical protein
MKSNKNEIIKKLKQLDKDMALLAITRSVLNESINTQRLSRTAAL